MFTAHDANSFANHAVLFHIRKLCFPVLEMKAKTKF